jgi:hypothetical protein
VLVAVVAVAVVAAVGVGIARHVGHHQGYPRAAGVALDNPATLDPCSAVTPEAFAGPDITVHMQPLDLATCNIVTLADRSNANGLIRVTLQHIDAATVVGSTPPGPETLRVDVLRPGRQTDSYGTAVESAGPCSASGPIGASHGR